MKVAVKLTLKIKRPNGNVEMVVAPKLKAITESQFRHIQAATKSAGRGEVLSCEIEYKDEKPARFISSREFYMAGVDTDRTVENMSRMGE